MDTKVNYARITMRPMASIIDGVIMLIITTILLVLPMVILIIAFDNNESGKDVVDMAFDFLESSELLLTFIICTFFSILEILMLVRFSGTPGQLLCGIHIKDANTLKNVTIKQAAIRRIFLTIIQEIILFSGGKIALLFAILFAAIFAEFDERKQFFHDKIARTVVIDYKPSS